MRKIALGMAAVILSAWAASAVLAAQGERPASTALEVLGRFGVPEAAVGSVADLRWAGRDSIYLAYSYEGISEVRLAPGLPEIRRVTRPTSDTGLSPIRHLAISDRWIVVGTLGRLAWTTSDGSAWQVKRGGPGFIHEIDIHGDELVILGSPDAENYERSPGGMVWRADLAKGLDHWDALYQHERVAQDFEVMRVEHALGSIRYLQGGELVTAPTFIPGALVFSPSGNLKKTVSPDEVWGDESAAKRKVREEREWWMGGRLPSKEWRGFLAAHRTIEEVLALPEGPGIVVREPQGDTVRYRLGVLEPDLRWYDIPVRNISAVAQLRGDVDARGRIVLMGVMRSASEAARVSASEVLILKLPQ